MEKKDDDEEISGGENETEGRMRFHFTFFTSSSPASFEMQMVPLLSIQEYESLPLTSWNIRQPSLDLDQEDALYSGIMTVYAVSLHPVFMSDKRLYTCIACCNAVTFAALMLTLTLFSI